MNPTTRINQNSKTLQKKRPTLPYYKIKSSQKRHFGSTGGVTISFGLGHAVSLLTFGFLTAFMFCIADGGGLGGGGGTNVNTVDPMLPVLTEMLDEVNTYRRNLMHQFREEPNMANNMFQLLNSNYNLFAANHPILLRDYEIIQSITQRIIAQSLELYSYQFAEAATRFESIINEWDELASQLESMIRNLDPNYDFGSDTDSEDIQQAAEEIAGRANNDGRGGAGSPSK